MTPTSGGNFPTKFEGSWINRLSEQLNNSADLLIILTNYRAKPAPDGSLVLTQKFLEGVAEHARFWPGRTLAIVEASENVEDTNFDQVAWNPAVWPFELDAGGVAAGVDRALPNARAVLAFLSEHTVSLVANCKRHGIPLVYISEYSFKTECQIVDTETRNPVLRLRRKLWLARRESKRLAAIAEASGIQCSGTPTFERYKKVSRNALVFFDSRVRESEVIQSGDLDTRLRSLQTAQPLRLVFGGRLIPMKGAHHLPMLAAQLRDLEVPFTLEIYGDGPERERLLSDIKRLHVTKLVNLKGSLDFRSGWIPMLQRNADLFVCCHTQGDPSSTYPEVMSCGVPIAGFANDAFRGVVEHSAGGWTVPVGKIRPWAQLIKRLHNDRDEIRRASIAARAFALEHVFEKTFQRRAEHILQCSQV